VYCAAFEREGINAVAPPPTQRLVRNGDPMRIIGFCPSCHSPHAECSATPMLEGLSEIYLHEQLTAFRDYRHSNDINRQMCNAVPNLSDQEIA
jgi:cytochrome c553